MIRFRVPGNKEGEHKNEYFDSDNQVLPSKDRVRTGGMTLMVRYLPLKEDESGNKTGDERDVDISCDSDYMLRVMPRVGEAIRAAYHWVDDSDPIYLFLDNAGGHGTDEAVEKYCNLLAEEYHVICYHQRPRSPATNMLDLGVWMAFQNVVERMHFRRRMEAQALARTVERSWEDLEPVKLENVYRRWKLVLDLIIEDQGGNAKVESRRGKLYSAPAAEAEIHEELDEELTDEMIEAREIVETEFDYV